MNDDKIYCSWNEVVNMCYDIAKKIRSFYSITPLPRFNAIFAIPRGGLPIARIMAELLDIEIISTDLWGYTTPAYRYLIVDDISDTGKTFLNVIEHFLSDNIHYGIATLYIRKGTKTMPDWYAEMIPDKRWVEFPWEKEMLEMTKNVA